jgi:tetratricopeptide (TPR) repeat protein
LIVEAWRDQVHYRLLSAFETYREALRRWPDDRAILGSFSNALSNWFHFEEALDVSRRASTLYPKSHEFLHKTQFFLSLLGYREEAVAAARRVTTEYPDNPNVWDELGIRYLSAGLPDSAEAAFRQALKVDPHFLPSLQGEAIVPFYRGNTHLAIDHLERISERTDLSPRDQYTMYYMEYVALSLVKLCVEAGQFQRALELMDEAGRLRSDPVDRLYHERYKIRVLLRTGRYREALGASRRLALYGEEEPEVAATEQFRFIARLGTYANPPRALAGLDSLAEARTALAELSREARNWGNFGKMLLNRATVEVSLAEGDPSTAMKTLEEIERIGYPRVGELAMWHFDRRAEAHVLAGQLLEAASVLEEELRIFGGHAIARYELGKIYGQLGRPEEATEHLTTFLEMWSEADEDLPQLLDARQLLQRL